MENNMDYIEIEVAKDDTVLPQLAKNILNILNNNYQYVHNNKLSDSDRKKLIEVSNKLIDINQDLLDFIYPDRPKVAVKYIEDC
jgi:hypothetical protein|tara:strand:- start:204 stop:455 length:252 start_codon:yes stop_codon:yes gene_type:complete